MADDKVHRGTAKKRKSTTHMKRGKRDHKRLSNESFGVKKMDRKTKSLFRKRARDYNSDDDDGAGENSAAEETETVGRNEGSDLEFEDNNDYNGEERKGSYSGSGSDSEVEEEEARIQSGVMRFSEGCNAFQRAFKKITETNVSAIDDVLGPVLSANKKLVAEKLAEEQAESKAKGEAKKEKHLVQEKGHVKPTNYSVSNEKFLIGVATKGVVKLFNAVNKAQHAQKGLDPSRFRDRKAIRKKRKEAFFSELGKTPSSVGTTVKVGISSNRKNGDGPAWAPLRDNYMLTTPKLKDWDKMPNAAAASDKLGMVHDTDASSDED